MTAYQTILLWTKTSIPTGFCWPENLDKSPSPKIYFLNNLGLVLILTSEFLGLEPSSPRIIP